MIAGLLAILFAGGLQGSVMDNAPIEGDIAHVFLPRVLVSEGRAVDAVWSDDGQYLIVVSVDLPVPPKFYKAGLEGKPAAVPEGASLTMHAYSVRSGISKQIWSAKGAYDTSATSAFFAGSDVAVVQISGIAGTEGTEVFRVTLGTSRVAKVETLPRPGWLREDPEGKYIAVVQGPLDLPMSVRFIPPSGGIFPRQPIPSTSDFRWGVGSVPFLIQGNQQVTLINPAGGLREVDRAPEQHEPNVVEPKLQVRSSSMPVPGREEAVDLVLAGLRGLPRMVLVGFEGNGSVTSPTDTGVFYRGGTQNFIRPVVQVSKTALDEMIAKAERAKVMAIVNQIGRALQMYASNNGGRFPTQEEFQSGAIDPYTMGSGMTDGFVYTPSTPSNNPAEVQLVYRPCPGGRIIVFQDGHTVFVPDP